MVGQSYDELLMRFGRPSRIEPTKWWYKGGPSHVGLWFEMVNGYVGGLQVYN